MYDRILVPTDGETGTERAIRHALDLATVHGAELRAIYVTNTASYGSLPMETSWEGISQMLADEGRRALERVEELAEGRAVPVETHLIEGAPAREIVRLAGETGCDVIVMGTHGREGIDRLLLGSVAERVVRSSPVPVLTVSVGEKSSEEPTREGVQTGDREPADDAAGTDPDDGTETDPDGETGVDV